MRYRVPHPIPYQGSKRRLADAILSHVPPNSYKRLIEPFAGSAALTLAAAREDCFGEYLLGDALAPLAELWCAILHSSEAIAGEYEALWTREQSQTIDEYYAIRAEFNQDRSPAKLLYLLARCVKNSVRFNPAGDFNQSPDKRRTGTHPKTMRAEILGAHRLLHGRTEVVAGDFMALLERATPQDFVYLDPPYQGTSNGKDRRYLQGVSRESVIASLELLNAKGVSFILSYDGAYGDHSYGDPLSSHLAHQLHLDVGRSSQATLNGGSEITVESLYLSHDLADREKPTQVTLKDFEPQAMLF